MLCAAVAACLCTHTGLCVPYGPRTTVKIDDYGQTAHVAFKQALVDDSHAHGRVFPVTWSPACVEHLKIVPRPANDWICTCMHASAVSCDSQTAAIPAHSRCSSPGRSEEIVSPAAGTYSRSAVLRPVPPSPLSLASQNCACSCPPAAELDVRVSVPSSQSAVPGLGSPPA